MTDLDQIKFYMVLCVPIGKWVGKHSSNKAFMTDDFGYECDYRQGPYSTWWMDDPINAKVWTDLADIRTMRNRANRLWDRVDSRKFTNYSIVRFPDMVTIPLDEI